MENVYRTVGNFQCTINLALGFLDIAVHFESVNNDCLLICYFFSKLVLSLSEVFDIAKQF